MLPQLSSRRSIVLIALATLAASAFAWRARVKVGDSVVATIQTPDGALYNLPFTVTGRTSDAMHVTLKPEDAVGLPQGFTPPTLLPLSSLVSNKTPRFF